MGDYFSQAVGKGSPFGTGATSSSFNSITIDGATDATEWIFQPPDAITVTHIGFRYTLRTGTPVEHKISFQGVSSGVPDGTIKGGGSPNSGTFTPPADDTWDGTWRWIALDNNYVTTRGEMLAVVIEPTGIPDGSNSSAFTLGQRFWGSDIASFPFAISNNAGSRTKELFYPVYGYKSASRSYGNPLEAMGDALFDLDTTPDEKGLRFILASGWGDTFQVVGIGMACRLLASSTVLISLYEDTTTKQTITIDTDDVGSASAGRNYEFYFDEATLSTLNFGTAYILALAPQGVPNVQVPIITVDTNAELEPMPGGKEFQLATREGSGDWDIVDNQRPMIWPILADVTEPSGGGGTPYIIGG